MRAPAVTGPTRNAAALPDVPILDKLNADARPAPAVPDLRRRLAEQGIDPVPTTRAQCVAFMAAETAKWAKVIEDPRVSIEQ